jgi:hypothetical protein
MESDTLEQLPLPSIVEKMGCGMMIFAKSTPADSPKIQILFLFWAFAEIESKMQSKNTILFIVVLYEKGVQ